MMSSKDSRFTTIIFLQSISIVMLLVGGVVLYTEIHHLSYPESSISRVSGETPTTPISVLPVPDVVVHQAVVYSFDYTGIIIVQGDEWFLRYDLKDHEQQLIPVIFKPESICVSAEGYSMRCDDQGVLLGRTVRITGNSNDRGVTVGVLTVLP